MLIQQNTNKKEEHSILNRYTIIFIFILIKMSKSKYKMLLLLIILIKRKLEQKRTQAKS